MNIERNDECSPFDPNDAKWICTCKLVFDPPIEVPALSEKSLLSRDYIYFEGGMMFRE